jgi:hypothetical protein
MTTQRTRKEPIAGLGLSVAVVLATLLVLALLLTRGEAPVAQAQGSLIRYVATTGSDTDNDCADPGNPCRTVQHAVDVADTGDEIRVAGGTYTGVSGRPRTDVVSTGVVTQVVYISKTVTVRGGYSITNWVTPAPAVHLTTVDAGRQGRALYITGEISPTLEGLRITGGEHAVARQWQRHGRWRHHHHQQ